MPNPLRRLFPLLSTGNCSSTTFSAVCDQHRISITVKPVACLHGLFIGAAQKPRTCERGNQHQEGRLRQMEIRQERIYHLELESWSHEKARFSSIRLQRPAQSRCFNGTYHRGTDGDDL